MALRRQPAPLSTGVEGGCSPRGPDNPTGGPAAPTLLAGRSQVAGPSRLGLGLVELLVAFLGRHCQETVCREPSTLCCFSGNAEYEECHSLRSWCIFGNIYFES